MFVEKTVNANRRSICKIDVLALDIFETKRFVHDSVIRINAKLQS